LKVRVGSLGVIVDTVIPGMPIVNHLPGTISQVLVDAGLG
jgi:hypothetical protein